LSATLPNELVGRVVLICYLVQWRYEPIQSIPLSSGGVAHGWGLIVSCMGIGEHNFLQPHNMGITVERIIGEVNLETGTARCQWKLIECLQKVVVQMKLRQADIRRELLC